MARAGITFPMRWNQPSPVVAAAAVPTEPIVMVVCRDSSGVLEGMRKRWRWERRQLIPQLVMAVAVRATARWSKGKLRSSTDIGGRT
jgi:hypothetical protein